jgi:hypothetical protein
MWDHYTLAWLVRIRTEEALAVAAGARLAAGLGAERPPRRHRPDSALRRWGTWLVRWPADDQPAPVGTRPEARAQPALRGSLLRPGSRTTDEQAGERG